MELKGSQTEKNLYTAFAGETQAHAKYMFYSKKAKKEGYEQIAEIFEYTALNELEHAYIWFKSLGFVSDTLNNLEDARSGENFEWSKMYYEFANTAKDEGFIQLERLFRGIADIELSHEERFKKLLCNMNNSLVFEKNDIVMWECRECGHIHVGKKAPAVCPICTQSQSFFQIKPENY